MNDNMILLNKEMPPANDEMPLGKMTDENQMPSSGNMPTGTVSANMPGSYNTAAQTGDMPQGSMHSSSSGLSSQLLSGSGMPAGSMNDGGTGSTGQTVSGGGEMPSGGTSKNSTEESNSKTINLSGSWKLQLTVQ